MIQEIFSLFKYQSANVARAKWLWAYALFFFFFISALLMFGSNPAKATASVLNVVLLIVPMISVLYSSIYWYSSETFTSLLLTQPLRRSSVFIANWLALSVGLAGSFAISTALALLVNQSLDPSTALVLVFGMLLSFIFVGLGLMVSVLVADRMKGVGLIFLIWMYFSILHDALVFALVSMLKDYPIEVPTMFLMASNPIDLARVDLLLSLDQAAMMGYTGKVLQQALSGSLGLLLVGAALLLWIAIPVFVGLRIFSRKDL